MLIVNGARSGTVMMLRRLDLRVPTSRVWLPPDLALGFHHFEYREGEYDGLPHTHADNCIIMCLSGSLELVYPDRRTVIPAGESLTPNPGQAHRCRSRFEQRNPPCF